MSNNKKHLYKFPLTGTYWIRLYGGDWLEMTLSDISQKPLYMYAYSVIQAGTYIKRRICDIMGLRDFKGVSIYSLDICDITDDAVAIKSLDKEENN